MLWPIREVFVSARYCMESSFMLLIFMFISTVMSMVSSPWVMVIFIVVSISKDVSSEFFLTAASNTSFGSAFFAHAVMENTIIVDMMTAAVLIIFFIVFLLFPHF